MTDATTLAMDLILNGFFVFPVNPDTKEPYTLHGHLDASNDPEAVGVWFMIDYPDARVGVATGRSGIIVLDVDVRPDKNGFTTLEDEWLEIPDTFNYETPSGGRHYWLAEPIGHYKPQRDYRGLPGVDRKSASSYVIVYGEAPKSRDEIAEAPGWLLDESADGVGSSFEGGLDSWLNELATGEPNGRVSKAIEELPQVPFDHPAMIEAQYRLVRLAAEGSPGVRVALDLLRDRWLTDPWNDADHAYEFDAGLYGAIKKAGAEDQQIADLPPYIEALDHLPAIFNTDLLIGDGDKRDWFRVLRALAEVGAATDIAVSVLWNAPKTQKWSREWQIAYCVEQYEKQTAELAERINNPVGDPEGRIADPLAEKPRERPSLLTDDERALVMTYTTFFDRYLAYAKSRTVRLNEPYHRQAALDILSLGFAFRGFIPEAEGSMGLGFFTHSLGKSSSGKSRALKLRDACLFDLFADDLEFNLGSDTSIQSLHEDLLERDKLPSFFNADESAVFFAMLQDQKYLSGMSEFLTRLYEGYVPPFRRRGRTDNGKTAMTHFSISFQGTPDRVTGLLTREMFLTGFLPRFVWYIGDEPIDDDTQFNFSQADEKRAKMDFDPAARAIAAEIKSVRKMIGVHQPVLATPAALERLADGARGMRQWLRRKDDWEILEPSWKRLAFEATRKYATLMAMSEGMTTVEERHVLMALVQAEEWCGNLVWVSREISASLFQRECDEIERWMMQQGGVVTRSSAFRRFGKYKPRDMQMYIESLKEQRRIKGDENLEVVR